MGLLAEMEKRRDSSPEKGNHSTFRITGDLIYLSVFDGRIVGEFDETSRVNGRPFRLVTLQRDGVDFQCYEALTLQLTQRHTVENGDRYFGNGTYHLLTDNVEIKPVNLTVS